MCEGSLLGSMERTLTHQAQTSRKTHNWRTAGTVVWPREPSAHHAHGGAAAVVPGGVSELALAAGGVRAPRRGLATHRHKMAPENLLTKIKIGFDRGGVLKEGVRRPNTDAAESDPALRAAPRDGGRLQGRGVRSERGCPPPPPLPTVAPTHVPTVHSLSPSLLLPLPMSLLYTHSLPPYCCPYPCPYCTLTPSLPTVAPTHVPTVHSLCCWPPPGGREKGRGARTESAPPRGLKETRIQWGNG